MKYGLWRHENALGNSACHVLALGKYIGDIKDNNPVIYVETEFQKHFARCINVPNLEIKFFKDDGIDVEYITDQRVYKNSQLNDIKMPSVYPFPSTYLANWGDLKQTDYRFDFPIDYENKHDLPKDSVVITIREANTYWKRIDGANSEPERSVNPQTFFDVALHYANKGYKVIRLGDPKQTNIPEHENIIDFSKVENRNMLDDMYAIANCKVHLSCDSGIWPMTAGFGSKLVLSNVTSALNNKDIVEWLPKEYTKHIYKTNNKDNTFEQLIEAVESLI